MNNFQEERILAIDFGSKRVGLALTDPLKMFAYPFKTLENNNNLIDEISTIVKSNNVVKILLGYPLREDGRKSDITYLVEKFCERLKSRISLEIIYWDERYTSELAKADIIEIVKKKKNRRDKGLVDRTAACIILKEYLEEINSKT
ncbi:MAG: Holliday junction resolvase RuvX [Ignavibacteriales bacterium]|nr:Holliday junction resolvase RuvX [Ignavibacteriales bacterium]